MKFQDIYGIALKDSNWTIPQNFDACFDWKYDDSRKAMMGLYQKGKEYQWDATTRIDWSQELDPENPQQLPEEMLPIWDMPLYQKMSPKEKANIRLHQQAFGLSQFMQGEQGALVCAAKIVTQVPDMDAKFYASTQVIDEARHVAFGRLTLREYYPQLTQGERNEREEFLIDACWHMRDRFDNRELWEALDLPVDACM